MATYFVGDLQGCYDELQALLEKVQFNEHEDKLYLAGDLVARGDKSLQCLRLVKALGNSAQTVLGNHDLHLIATKAGVRKPKDRDHIAPILTASDSDELIHWLRQQPLCVHLAEQNIVLSHGGISPQWDLATALNCAEEVQKYLQSDDYEELLVKMYALKPNFWRKDLTGFERLVYIINAFTRMRYCFSDGRLELKSTMTPSSAPKDLYPWFELSNPLYKNMNIIFGHWSSLRGYQTPTHIYALDTGCVWGGELTMLRWEDGQKFSQPALKNYQP